MRPTDLDIRGLLSDMKVVQSAVVDAERQGVFKKVFEVGPDSFVQILQAVPLTAKPEPVTWSYLQSWVHALSPADRALILGAFQNEMVGMNKIIGIYENSETVHE